MENLEVKTMMERFDPTVGNWSSGRRFEELPAEQQECVVEQMTEEGWQEWEWLEARYLPTPDGWVRLVATGGHA